MECPAHVDGKFMESEVVTKFSLNWRDLFAALGLPTDLVTSFKLEISGTEPIATVTLQRYLTEQELAALVAELEANPPTTLEKKETLK